MRRWSFLTNHALILIHIVQHHRSTVREIALACDITERATVSILRDLREAKIVEGRREGRRNVYSVNFDALARYRRAGPAPSLLPDPFVRELVKDLLRLSGGGARQAPSGQHRPYLGRRPPTAATTSSAASAR